MKRMADIEEAMAASERLTTEIVATVQCLAAIVELSRRLDELHSAFLQFEDAMARMEKGSGNV